jgi:hypothetical protein
MASLATHTQALRYAQRKLLNDLPHRVQSNVSHERCRNRWAVQVSFNGSSCLRWECDLRAVWRTSGAYWGFPRLSPRRCLSIGRDSDGNLRNAARGRATDRARRRPPTQARPKGMHRRTYRRLELDDRLAGRRRCGVNGFLERLDRQNVQRQGISATSVMAPRALKNLPR